MRIRIWIRIQEVKILRIQQIRIQIISTGFNKKLFTLDMSWYTKTPAFFCAN